MKIITVSAIWCPSCLIMRPRFESVAQKYSNIELKTYDLDFDEEVLAYNVGHILPVFIIFDDKGTELGRLIGEQKLDILTKMVEDHF